MKKIIRKIILWAFKEDVEDFETVKDYCKRAEVQEDITRRRLNRLYKLQNIEPSREMPFEEWKKMLFSNRLGFNKPV